MNKKLKEAYKRILENKIETNKKTINENIEVLSEDSGGLLRRLLRWAYGDRGRNIDRFFPGAPSYNYGDNYYQGGLYNIWRNTGRSLNNMVPPIYRDDFYDRLYAQFPKFYKSIPDHSIIDTIVTPGGANIIIIKTTDGRLVYQYVDEGGMRVIKPTEMPVMQPDGSYIFPDGFFEVDDNFLPDLNFDPENAEDWGRLFLGGLIVTGGIAYDATADDMSDEIIDTPPPAPVEQTPEYLTRPGREWHPPMN